MTNLEQAKHEVELLNASDCYDRLCYESALKAYESLCEDGHSIFSISVTMSILHRLVDGLPLSEIRDTDDEWIDHPVDDNRGYKSYQCKRYTALFKDVYDDGHIVYTDVDRTIIVNADDPSDSWSGWLSCIVNEMFPISMPYYPPSKKYRLFARYVSEDDDATVVEICHVIKPDGSKIDINKIYRFDSNGVRTEIKNHPNIK